MTEQSEQNPRREFEIPTALWSKVNEIRALEHKAAVLRCQYDSARLETQAKEAAFWAEFRTYLLESGTVQAEPADLAMDLERAVVYVPKPNPMASLMQTLGGK